jgi:hypothetical protein
MFGVAALAWTAAFAALSLVAFELPQGGVAGFALALGAAAGVVLVVRSAFQLLRWPQARICLFRDRLLVIDGRKEMRALWATMGAVTLSQPDSWPHVKITDRLSIQLRNEFPMVLKPALFGLQPAACRDLIVRLRDDPKLRARLPEFDSVRDLAISPVVAGELTEPRL